MLSRTDFDALKRKYTPESDEQHDDWQPPTQIPEHADDRNNEADVAALLAATATIASTRSSSDRAFWSLQPPWRCTHSIQRIAFQN